MAHQASGTCKQVMTTYHSGDGWYLEIPETWNGDFSMQRQESSTIGVRTVTFAQGVEGEESVVTPFLEISCLVGNDRTRQAEEGERFILYSDAITIYTAQFLDSDWDCGLDQEGLKARFHTSQDNWDTSQ